MSKLKYKLEAHQIDMERQRVRLDREMEGIVSRASVLHAFTLDLDLISNFKGHYITVFKSI